MRFVLHELHGLEQLNAYPKYADFTPDVVDSVLEEAAKIATEVILPTNMVGDQEGCVLENGVVRTPTGFKQAYDLFREGGWDVHRRRSGVGRPGHARECQQDGGGDDLRHQTSRSASILA